MVLYMARGNWNQREKKKQNDKRLTIYSWWVSLYVILSQIHWESVFQRIILKAINKWLIVESTNVLS